MNEKYGVLTKDEQVDKKGYIYRVVWCDSLQQAYSLYLKGDQRGQVIKDVSVVVIEKR